MPPQKKRLMNRVRRIRGQVEALERSLDEEAECADHAARDRRMPRRPRFADGRSDRGTHLVSPARPARAVTESQTQAADDLIDALKTYLK
jgi:DNA-binding FrmR family transcriptional regulator